jgi:hypothetical protein
MKKKDRIGKINIYLTLIIRVTLILAIPIAIWEKNWLFAFLSGLTFFLTFISKIVKKRYNLKIPAELEIIIVLFIYAGIFLGGVREFYYKYWWWNYLLHLLAGVSLGFAGFLILYVLHKTERLKTSPFLIVFFSFCFALSIGALWEIFEFSIDFFFGYNMQKARGLENIYGYCDTYFGVIDTMFDLILDAIGALIASIAGYFYLKKGEVFLFDSLVKKFEKQNRRLFRIKENI